MNDQLFIRQKIALVSATEDQKKAITTNGKSILVAASAGSGKTNVLSKRILSKILLKECTVKEILALTFTNAAAKEMRTRIGQLLNHELNVMHYSDDEMRKMVFHQEEKYVQLKKIYESFTPLSEEEKTYLKSEIGNLMNASITTIDAFALSILQKFYPVLKDFNVKRLDTMLSASLKTAMLRKSIKQALQPYRSKHQQLLQQYPELIATFEYLIHQLAIFNRPIEKIAEWKMIANDVLASPTHFTFYQTRLMMLADELFILLNALEYPEKMSKSQMEKKQIADALLQILFTYKQNKDVHDFANNWKMIAPFKAFTSKNLSEVAKQRIKDAEKLYFKLSELIVVKHVNEVSIFYEMLQDAYLKYEENKALAVCIEFSDITRLAIQILENYPHIQKQYQSLYHEILVDEFQDTNEIQDYFIRLISKNENNIFRVGDVKQSIYGFRQAKPQMMKNYYTTFKDETKGQNIVLNTNFRSKPMVIAFNNVLYQNLMNVRGYPSMFETSADFAHYVPSTYLKPTIFYPLVYDKIDDEKAFEFIASEIIHHASQKEYRQFALLVRSNHHIKTALKVFRKANVPCFGVEDALLYENEFVQLMISLLTLVLQPNNDLAFSVVYTSNLFQESFDALAKLSLQKEKSFYHSINHHSLNTLMQALKQTTCIEAFFQVLANHEVNHSNYYDHHLTRQQQMIFEKLLQLFHENQIITLEDALTYLNDLKYSDIYVPSMVSPEENVVKIMTIHRSKGLEFDEVYLYCKDTQVKDTNGFCAAYNDELGIAFYGKENQEKVSTLYTELIHAKNLMNEVNEDLRILYVATTRPKNQLHIVGYSKYNNDLLNLSLLEGSKKYCSYILANQDALRSFKINEQAIFEVSDPIQLATYEFLTLEKQHEQVIPKNVYQKQTQAYELSSAHRIEKVQPLLFEDTYQQGLALHALVEQYGKKVILQQHVDIEHPKIKKLFENEQFQQLLQQEVYFEMPFFAMLSKQLVSGYIDFIAIADKITIIDFKSDQFSQYEDKKVIDEATLIQRYENQLLLYKNVMQLKYPTQEIACYLYSFTLGKMIEVK